MEFKDITRKLIGQLKKKYFYDEQPNWQGFFGEISKDAPEVAQDLYRARDQKPVMDFLKYMNRLPARLFMGFNGIEEIVLPPNIDQIGGQLFKDCKNLQKVTIEGDVREIPFECFSGCDSLQEVHLPATVRKIGKGAFQGCPELGFMIYKDKSGENLSVQGSQAEVEFIQSHIQGTTE